MNCPPEIETFIRTAAQAHGLNADLAVRQCQAESNYNPSAVSRCGAIGLFQLMPATAKELGIDPHDWKQNVLGWAEYMQSLMRLFNRDMPQVLAAYNWGMGNVRRVVALYGAQWKSHLPAETSAYLKKILES